MRAFSKLTLAGRLTWGFGIILAFLIGIAGLSLERMQALSSALEVITVRNAEASKTIASLNNNVARYVQVLGDLGSTELGGLAEVFGKAQSALAEYDKAQVAITALLPKDTAAQALLSDLDEKALAARELIALGEKLAAGRGVVTHAFQVRNEYGNDTAKWSARQQAWTDAVHKLNDWQSEANAVVSAKARASAEMTQIFLIAGALLALAFGAGVAIWLVRDTKSAIKSAVQATQRMAKHDLSQPVVVNRQDEVGGLLTALEGMRQNMYQLAQGVRFASDGIGTASSEIAQGSADLSERTEHAATTLQLTMSSMGEMGASVEQTKSASQSATHLSEEASDIATRGGVVMGQVVATMNEIDAASRKIADITSIIDGIAFQTNILALNAAVEAARAGEQGRGFAVVASEVRALAGRSAEAAKEIKNLITASQQKVASGSELVAVAGQNADEVIASVGRVTSMIGSIAAENAYQVDRLATANQSIGSLDVLAHQNAALAEESAAAAASLSQQAIELSALVSKFDLGVQIGGALTSALGAAYSESTTTQTMVLE